MDYLFVNFHILFCLFFQMDVELFYRFSPILMQKVPKETVDALISKRDHLQPKRLIPALVQNDRGSSVDQVWDLSECKQM